MTRTPRHCEEGNARRGNAAIKPRAESSSLELCRGGAGSTEGQSQSSLRGLVQAVAIYFTTIDPHVAIAPRDDVVF